jgi:ribose/xylose/arabinose/galactoside ABC-type transport system permease subunit
MADKVKLPTKDAKASGPDGSTGRAGAESTLLGTDAAREVRTQSAQSRLLDFADKYATLVGFAVMVAFFWIDAPSTFGTVANFKAILDQTAVTVLLGVGLTAVLAVGEFDLSFPYALGLASAAATLMMTDDHAGVVIAVLVGIAAAVIAGAVAGFMVALQRASSFIVTLALGFVWLGLADGLTSSQTIVSGLTNNFVNLTSHNVLGFTDATVIAALFALAMGILFRWAVVGRYMLSVGSNPEASRLAGLRVPTIRLFAFALLGLGVGIAAIIITSRQAQYTPGIGQGLFLAPYVAAFFGMSVLGARRFNVFGTVIGALFIGTLQTGLTIIGAASWVGEFIQGAVLLIILLIARRSTR